MTRPLLIIAACAFIVSVACFGAVAALGGIQFRDGYDWFDHGFMDHGFMDDDWNGGPGPTISRELTWGGGDELSINVPANVEYTQGPVARLTVSGPQRLVERVELDGDSLRIRRHGRRVSGRLTVTMTAPDVSRFTLNGSQRLNIAGFDHERLEVAIHGSGDVTGAGKARRVEVEIAGSGEVDLAGVAAEAAEVDIAGSGDATVAPTLEAKVRIAGSGDVTLTTRPPTVDTRIAGSGRVVQAGPPAAPAPVPAPPATAGAAT